MMTIPEGLETFTSPFGFTIRRRWRSWMIAPLAVFAIGWDSFLVFWYKQALAAPNTPWIMIIFPIGHLAVGIGLTYFVIASFFNRTDIIITSTYVESLTKPLPWIGNKMVLVTDISDIVLRERVRNRGLVTYTVMYVDRSLKEQRLIFSLFQKEQAEYVASKIKEITGIKKSPY